MQVLRPELVNYKPERRNCTVIALAASAGIPYDIAHRIAEQAGRQKNRGFVSSKLLKYYNKHVGKTAFRKSKRSPITVQKFCKRYPTGRYFVRKRGHAFAIVDGVVYDKNEPKPLERICEAWKFQNNE